MKVLFLGDVIGKPGRRAVGRALPGMLKEHSPDVVIANGENAAGGYGLTEKAMHELFDSGAQVITSGNHIWDKKDTEKAIDGWESVIRPANFPPAAPGRGWLTIPAGEHNLAVINLQGRVTMPPADCPFRTLDRLLDEINDADAFLVDFHAEATSEKKALGYYADGRVAAIVGTHTHVQTADEKVLSRGTAYISDAGMCGGAGGVIGVDKDAVLVRFLEGLPRKMEPAKSNPMIEGVLIEIDPEKGTALSIKRFQEKAE